MIVRFVQSGGLLGATRTCQLNSEALSPDLGAELARLVDASELRTVEPTYSAGGRDLEEYEIIIDHERETVIVLYDSETLPSAARPLVAFLKRHASPLRR